MTRPIRVPIQGLRGAALKAKLGHAAASVADLSARSDPHHRGFGVPTRGWKGGVFPRHVASVSARPKRSEELPDVYQPVDRQWDGAAASHRARVRSTVGDGEALLERPSATG